MSLQLLLPTPSPALADCDTQLNSQQSLCLVKIFLNASLGCICFVRGLLRSDSRAFQNRQVDDLLLTTAHASALSYEEFTSFHGQLSADGDSQPFKILIRGEDYCADHLLELVVSNAPILCHLSEDMIRCGSNALPAKSTVTTSFTLNRMFFRRTVSSMRWTKATSKLSNSLSLSMQPSQRTSSNAIHSHSVMPKLKGTDAKSVAFRSHLQPKSAFWYRGHRRVSEKQSEVCELPRFFKRHINNSRKWLVLCHYMLRTLQGLENIHTEQRRMFFDDNPLRLPLS